MRPSGSPLTTVQAWRIASAVAGTDAMPYSGDCMSPVTHEVRGRESALLARLKDIAVWRDEPWSDYADGYGWIGLPPNESMRRTATAYVRVRCRKCEPCLRYRRRLWTARAIAELRVAPRTWFGTLTYAPPERFNARMRADQLARLRRFERIEDLVPAEQFRAMERQTSRDVTLWLKRVRKAAQGPLRYLLVSEAHEDGFPHYHLLVHERRTSAVTKRLIESQWKKGFSHWRLIDPENAKATGYVCKYLSKTASTRVRASQHYGDVKSRLTELIGDATNIASKMLVGKTMPSNEGSP